MSRLLGGFKRFMRDSRIWTKRYFENKWQGLAGEPDLGARDPFTIFDFTNANEMKKLEAISDQQFGGLSNLSFGRSKYNRALFSGHLDVTVPEHIDVDYSGHAGVRSYPLTGLFDRPQVIDLVRNQYDCLEVKYRGDGRAYLLNLQTRAEVNRLVEFNDVFQAFLFTKGGPYWEIERFPFSQFLMTHEGALQDRQIHFGNIDTIGFSLNDQRTGDFFLEIEYVKAVQVCWQPKRLFGIPHRNPNPKPESMRRHMLSQFFGDDDKPKHLYGDHSETKMSTKDKDFP